MGEVIELSTRRHFAANYKAHQVFEADIIRMSTQVRAVPPFVDESHIMRLDPPVYQVLPYTTPTPEGADLSLLGFYAPTSSDHWLAQQDADLQQRRRGFIERFINWLK